MANKMTKKDYFNAILAIKEVSANAELVDFINHELELLAKKNASRSNGELTETQKENLALGNEILAYIGTKSNVTISDIRKHFGLSSQKVTPIVTKLVNDNKVTKTIEKRVSYFTIVE